MKHTRYGSIGIGAPSIMLIAVVLCLTVFGVLALLSARNDARLTDETIESIRSYYEADGKAQLTLAAIDDALLHNTGDLPAEVVASRDGGADGKSREILSFQVKIDEKRLLNVILDVDEGNEKRYTVLCYNVIPSGQWKADDSLNVY